MCFKDHWGLRAGMNRICCTPQRGDDMWDLAGLAERLRDPGAKRPGPPSAELSEADQAEEK